MTSEDVARRHGMSELKAAKLAEGVKDPAFACDLFDRMLSESLSVIQSAYNALDGVAYEAPEAAPKKPSKKSSKKK